MPNSQINDNSRFIDASFGKTFTVYSNPAEQDMID